MRWAMKGVRQTIFSTLAVDADTDSDALDNPIKFILTSGEASDFLQACPLLERKKGSAVLADKGYDA